MPRSATQKQPTTEEKLMVYESLLQSIGESTLDKERINEYLANISDWAHIRETSYQGKTTAGHVNTVFWNLLNTSK
jgi:hypothetical protein